MPVLPLCDITRKCRPMSSISFVQKGLMILAFFVLLGQCQASESDSSSSDSDISEFVKKPEAITKPVASNDKIAAVRWRSKSTIKDARPKTLMGDSDEVDKDLDLVGEHKQLVEIDVGFIHAFLASLSVIIVSELGDKTFFIAAIMAMRHPRVTVFAGAMLALGLMTILSALLGYATTVIPHWITYYVSSLLFAVFGIKMLREAYTMDANVAQNEYEEVQTELRTKEEELENQAATDAETGIVRTPQRRMLYSLFSRIFLQSFTLTFLAEWGDRSQIATIILAARDEVTGVIIGGTVGHALCTSLAVIGGRCIAQHISIKTVHLIGGIVFLIFALSAFFIEPDDQTR